jgi:hypothetical protein
MSRSEAWTSRLRAAAATDRAPWVADRLGLSVEVVGTYVVVRRRLRRRDLPAVVQDLRAAPRRARRPASGWDGPRLAAAAVRVLNLLPGDSRCLTRSLVVLAVLARRGIAARLIVAARPEPSFAAHAWIEQDGRPLLPTEGFGDAQLAEL